MYIPEEVNYIIETLNNNNFEAFVVGGCVRDSIMGMTPKDYDIATSATPLNIKPLFKKTVDTGINHGTITVVLNKNNYEVTTYRIDGDYNDCRRPKEVYFTTKLEDDLVRRDFTINAIAYHKNVGFIDPYRGIEDITIKCIRGVGDPNKRFQEDALRMLRAIRFSSQLDFDVEPITYKALLDNAHLISNISVERIRDELNKTFLGKNLTKALLIIESNILKYISPNLNNYLQTYLEKSIGYMAKADFSIIDRLVILFRYLNSEEVINFMKLLKYSNQEIKQVTILHKYTYFNIQDNVYSVRKTMSILGKDLFFNLIKIKEVLGQDIININFLGRDVISNNDPLIISDLDINGNILKKNNICEGKEIGRVLDGLLDLVLMDPKLNKESILLDNCYKLLDK